ncbi:unnamed protein product [Amaranthus hypochondriacus]
MLGGKFKMKSILHHHRQHHSCNSVSRKGLYTIEMASKSIVNAPSSIISNIPEQILNPTQVQTQTDQDIIKLNSVISNYMRRGQCESALHVFNSMLRRTVVSWNAMISGYLSNDKFQDAHQVFETMPVRDLFSWNLMLKGYAQFHDLTAARCFFEKMPKRDIVSWNTMLSVYAQGGFVDEARKLFDGMPNKNSISWNGILSAYVQNGRVDEAAALFASRQVWELVAWNCLMGGYVKSNRLVEARALFERMPTRDEVSWSTIISAYAKNGCVAEAESLFLMCPSKDVFTGTTMVSVYIRNNMLDEARGVFDQMPKRNIVTWNSMLAGYVHCKRMDIAREFFEAMPTRSVTSWNTMISGYARSGDITEARMLFNKMPLRDAISWSAMISAYAQNSDCEEALHLFVEMLRNRERPNKSVFTCVLSTCADTGVLEFGMQVHGIAIKVGLKSSTYVGNALVALYCKCGSIDEANYVFEGILEKDTVTWNTMIAGYAKHGFGQQALGAFESMIKAGARADDATMVAVLYACAHAGLIDRAKRYFYAMYSDYGIVPCPRHYTCMVDLLGRAGKLEEAQNLILNMPFAPDAAAWGALLGAAMVHRNLELAEKSAEIIFDLEPTNSGMYVLLSNLYAASERWYDVRKMRLRMRDKGVKKMPGYSWLEVQNKIHTFAAGDTSHPDKNRIYAFLEELESRLKQDGYVSSIRLVLHDVDEEEKEHMLKYHSERLAVAYGILSLPAQKPIRIMKNLRICEDCHTAIKHISKLENRLIIVRDPNRFHHFKEGSCSCGDYW